MGAIFANKCITRALLLVMISSRNFSVWIVNRPILRQCHQVRTGISCSKICKQRSNVLHFELDQYVKNIFGEQEHLSNKISRDRSDKNVDIKVRTILLYNSKISNQSISKLNAVNVSMYSLISSIGCSSNFVLDVVGSVVQKGFCCPNRYCCSRSRFFW